MWRWLLTGLILLFQNSEEIMCALGSSLNQIYVGTLIIDFEKKRKNKLLLNYDMILNYKDNFVSFLLIQTTFSFNAKATNITWA